MWSKREEDLWSFRQFIISECVVLLLCCGGWREEPGGGVCKSQFVAWTASFAHPYCTQTRNSPAARLPVLHPALYLDLSWLIFQMFGARQHIRRSHREGCLQEVKKMTKISASVLFLPLNGETWAGTEVLTFLKANRWANRWPPWAFHVVTGNVCCQHKHRGRPYRCHFMGPVGKCGDKMCENRGIKTLTGSYCTVLQWNMCMLNTAAMVTELGKHSTAKVREFV